MRIFAPLNSESDPVLQQIEVATFFQLPSFHIVGLPSPEVAEARERIRSAVEASGIEFPRRRVVLNLSPASIRKRGTGLDLAMALAVLFLGSEEDSKLGAWGELGLDGTVKPAGQITRALYAAWKGGLSFFVLSAQEYPAAQAALKGIWQSGEMINPAPRLIPVSSLSEARERVLRLDREIATDGISGESPEDLPGDLPGDSSVTNSPLSLLPLGEALERMIGTAVAGCHHLLLLGPRGTGKTQALEWFVALQPKALPQDRLKQQLLSELSRSSQSFNSDRSLGRAPIRRVGAQVRPSALIGGASSLTVRPGEYSLAHGGVLVADELPEWPRDSRESLREPLERGKVTLTRAQGSLELPAQFVLAANGNLCPCGGWPKQLPIPTLEKKGDEEEGRVEPAWSRCKCTDSVRGAYLSRLSGPLLDRIDLTLMMAQPAAPTVSGKNTFEKMISLRKKVENVRAQLVEKWGGPPGFLLGAQIELILHRYPELQRLLSRLPYASLRSRHKMVRVALSLSAWDGLETPTEAHFSEAGYYRPERYLFVD